MMATQKSKDGATDPTQEAIQNQWEHLCRL